LVSYKGDFQEVHTESVTVEEGQDLSLQCDFTGDYESALEWSNPRGFVIFLKSHRGLKDQRYKLIHYSTNKLSISLSNVTVQDEGTYTCFYYDVPVKTKKVNVTVLAAPSKPQLEVSDIRTNGKEEKIVLSCLTQGSKPPPQITWLLNNGLEVYGDIKHQFEHDGKKCNTTSSLIVHAYNRDSTASCVIRHETLRGEKLTVSFQFENFNTLLISTGSEMTEEPSGTEEPSISHEETTVNCNATISKFLLILNTKWAFLKSAWFPAAKCLHHQTHNEGHYRVALLPNYIKNISFIETDLNSEGIKQRQTSVLLPVLVAVLIFVMLIIVLLFMRKLQKAHGAWKRENDTSEQTLESYKSRSNEDNPAPEKNGPVANQKPTMQYVTEGYAGTIKSNSEERAVSTFEKYLAYGKETDV
uniref:Cytotoxic and regulatory T cell molecule n=1 Tax=Chelonoidis abingdonii TaxID=106734 RepID=A0A8C0GKG8_CHEAB